MSEIDEDFDDAIDAYLTLHKGDAARARAAALRAKWGRLAALETALGAIAALDPYPVEVWTPLTEAEEEAIRVAIRQSGVRHPLDRTYGAWGRLVGARYRALAREAMAPHPEQE